MSQLNRLLSEARNTADETSQDEQDFVHVRNKRKRTRNFPKTNSETIRPVVITINARPTQVHFARSLRSISLNSKLFASENFQTAMTSLANPKTKVQENV